MNKIASLFIAFTFTITLSILFCPVYAQNPRNSVIKGIVKSGESTLDYATVFLKGTQISTNSDESGNFILRVPPGQHILCVSYIGYQTYEKQIDYIQHQL